MQTTLRTAAVLIVLSACGGESHLLPKPLPQLVINHPAKSGSHVLVLRPQESLIWDVHAHGFTIGRAELVVGDDDVHSRFTTSSLASAFASFHHELTTTLDRQAGRPRTASETIDFDGEAFGSEMAFDGTRYALDNQRGVVVPDGNVAHTLHSALGWMRAWASPDAPPTYLYVLEAKRLFRLDLDSPIAEELQDAKTLRIVGRVGGVDPPISMTMWLTADEARTPIRISITTPSLHITAELVTSS